MSFFKPICCVCGKKAGITATGNRSFKMVCSDCRKKILNGTREINCLNLSTEECISRVKIYDRNHKELENYIPTKSIGKGPLNYMSVDDTNHKVAIFPRLASSSKIIPTICNYEDIINFEVIEDNNTIVSGGLGRAIVGNLLFGGVGAIVGGVTANRKSSKTCSSLIIRISTNNIDNNSLTISFIENEILKLSQIYKEKIKMVQECISLLEYICNVKQTPEKEIFIDNSTIADQLIKYKELLDNNAITQEEYNKLKKDLINK